MAKATRNIPRSRIITVGGRRIHFEPRTPLELLAVAEESQRQQRGGRSPRKTGKEWISDAYARRSSKLLAMTITDAGRKLSKESETAPDCAKPLSKGHCINLLRGLNVWSKKPRKSPRQRPK